MYLIMKFGGLIVNTFRLMKIKYVDTIYCESTKIMEMFIYECYRVVCPVF